MATRTYRELPQEVKDKISQSMKQYHSTVSTNKMAATRNKQAASMRHYWSTIPKSGNASSGITMDELIGAK